MRQSLCFLVLPQMHGWLGTVLWDVQHCVERQHKTLSEARIITGPNSKLR